MTGNACELFDLENPSGWDMHPLGYGATSETKAIGQSSEAAATAADDRERGHAICLPHVSGLIKEKMLTYGARSNQHIYRMQMGLRIKIAREAMDMSQRELADAIGVTHGLVGQWESTDKQPGRDRLIALAKATGRSVSWFIDEEPIDPASFKLRDSDEIELVNLFRQFTVNQRSSHLQLFRASATIRAEIEQQREPTKG